MAALVAKLQGDISIDVSAILLVFAVVGIAPIYRATRSLIEFNEAEILYTQLRFKILCKWEDFIGLRITSDRVALSFLNSRIFTLKFIAHTIKFLGLWNNTIPLSPI